MGDATSFRAGRWLVMALMLSCAIGWLSAAPPQASLERFSDLQGVTSNTFTTAVWTPTTVTLTSIGDTYLRGGNANTNQGSDAFLRIQQSGPNRALVLFDSTAITNAAIGHTLSTAKLRLYIESNSNNWGATGRTVDVHKVTVSWTELGATWNCPIDTNTANGSPDCATQWTGGTYTATATASLLHTNGLTGWVEWDVTADVAAFIATPASNLGWLVKKTAEGQAGQVDYTSREGGANAPQLYITFSP